MKKVSSKDSWGIKNQKEWQGTITKFQKSKATTEEFEIEHHLEQSKRSSKNTM